MKVTLKICDEALSLFAPLEPCSECRRPLPVPFEDNYEHWEGCSVGEAEAKERRVPAPRVVVVGEVNPYGADPRLALYHLPRRASGDRLRVILGLSDADYLRHLARRNLCAGRWDCAVARRVAQSLLEEDFSAYVLLGRRVAGAFRVPYGFEVARRGLKTLVSLPHPSGLCRVWNEPGSTGRAREILRRHVLGVPWGASEG